MSAPRIEHLADGVTLWPGDCLAFMRAQLPCTFDAVVCDPPYHLTSGGGARGFMGKAWDGGDVAFRAETWREVLRVLKPGGQLVAFSGSRTYHRMACAIEDAGFEIRDQLMWLYGKGFPKSMDISKAIDKAAVAALPPEQKAGVATLAAEFPDYIVRHPRSAEWQGWGTALKPAHESICLAKKPLQNMDLVGIIGSKLIEIWSALWLMLPANDAEQFSTLNPLVYGVDQRDFVQWDAERLSNIRAVLSDQMDMSQFASALISSLSTVSSWSVIWAESSQPANTFIIETELSTTMTLGTLKFLVSKITPESIMLAHKSAQWSIASASPAERIFAAIASRLSATLELSALVPAISKEVTHSQGVGARFSPAHEPICLARKPLGESTVAGNVLRWGTGGINVDACRVGLSEGDDPRLGGKGKWFPTSTRQNGGFYIPPCIAESSILGRWPANLLHDGSPEVLAGFPVTGPSSGAVKNNSAKPPSVAKGQEYARASFGHADNGGSTARFFYSSKAGPDDRCGSKHPTIKPVSLMQWLVRLVTPPGGRVLDPFAGSGTTGQACALEGFPAVLCEMEAEYQADIRRRMAMMAMGQVEKTAVQVVARGIADHAGPLFGGLEAVGGGRLVYGKFAWDRQSAQPDCGVEP